MPKGKILRDRSRGDLLGSGLDVGNAGAGGLFEMNFGTRQQGAETKVGQWQNHVKILPHITVVQQMMAIQAEENSGALDRTFARQMHAPVQIFVNPVVGAASKQGAANNSPTVQ